MSTMCKYHGPACEHPERCADWHPRKYDHDGEMERIDPQRLMVGHVVRQTIGGDHISAFSDSVVTGIYVKSWKDRGKQDRKFYDTLAQARAAQTKEDYVYVVLSRPYMYANNIGGGDPGWLVAVSTYEAPGERMEDCYKVVVQSTGEYASYNNREV